MIIDQQRLDCLIYQLGMAHAQNPQSEIQIGILLAQILELRAKIEAEKCTI